MPGRTLRLFAATAALALVSLSPAAAGWFDGGCCNAAPVAVNWGCASSGCAPLLPRFYYGQNCCAPVRWGCGDVCGYGGLSYAVSQPGYDYDVAPIHVVPQGPLYSPPLTGYTYPVMRYAGRSDYPYVSGYGSGYYGYRHLYRPYVRPGYRHGWRQRYAGGRDGHWGYSVRHDGPRYGGWHRMHHRGYPLRVRGQASPDAMYK
ncbi:MAG: hypothetical protein ACJ8D0_17100 [Xanthobacteraceae bacterium]